MKRQFNNRANEVVTDTTGKQHWISRSPAVVGVIITLCKDDVYVLIEKRSAIMDEPNKWALVSGYLDWDESGYEGIVRETYEETGFDIERHKDSLVFDYNKEPFYVQSDPKKDKKQNVSLSYIFVYKFKHVPTFVEDFENSEISQVKWLNIKDFLANEKDMDFAFNHNERIHMAIQKFLSK